MSETNTLDQFGTNPVDQFDRAATAAGMIIAGVKPEQLADPTPCPEWTVRQLVNHMVGGTLFFQGMVTGAGPIDRNADHLGDDPAAAFQDSVARLRAVFAAEGALDRVVPTPFGEQPIGTLVEMRVMEMLVHGWDVAKATGQSTDLDPELAESRLEAFRNLRATGRGAGMFADPQPAPPDAPAAARLAAAAGRSIT